MKRKMIAPLVLLVALAVCLGVFYPSVTAAGNLTPQSAEKTCAAAQQATVYVRGYNEKGTLISTGSGFLVSGDGMAVTAAHVVRSAARATVLLGEKELEAQLVFCDAKTDAAILRLPAGRYEYLAVADAPPACGALVRAMGYPMKGTAVITEGIVNSVSAAVSGKTRMMVSCQIVNGMSGGPVLDVYGRVVGVCSGSVITMSGIHLSVLTDELNAAISKAEEEKK